MPTTILTRLAVLLAMVAAISAGCSDSDPSPSRTGGAVVNPPAASNEPSTTPPPTKPAGNPTSETKAALIEVLKNEPDFADLPGASAAFLTNCMADVIIKHGKPASVEQYIGGSIKLDDIEGTDSAAAEEAGFACAENAAKAK